MKYVKIFPPKNPQYGTYFIRHVCKIVLLYLQTNMVQSDGLKQEITMFLFTPYSYRVEITTSAITLRLVYGKQSHSFPFYTTTVCTQVNYTLNKENVAKLYYKLMAMANYCI